MLGWCRLAARARMRLQATRRVAQLGELSRRLALSEGERAAAAAETLALRASVAVLRRDLAARGDGGGRGAGGAGLGAGGSLADRAAAAAAAAAGPGDDGGPPPVAALRDVATLLGEMEGLGAELSAPAAVPTAAGLRARGWTPGPGPGPGAGRAASSAGRSGRGRAGAGRTTSSAGDRDRCRGSRPGSASGRERDRSDRGQGVASSRRDDDADWAVAMGRPGSADAAKSTPAGTDGAGPGGGVLDVGLLTGLAAELETAKHADVAALDRRAALAAAKRERGDGDLADASLTSVRMGAALNPATMGALERSRLQAEARTRKASATGAAAAALFAARAEGAGRRRRPLTAESGDEPEGAGRGGGGGGAVDGGDTAAAGADGRAGGWGVVEEPQLQSPDADLVAQMRTMAKSFGRGGKEGRKSHVDIGD